MNFKKENKRERSTIKSSISAFVNKIVQDSYNIGTSNYGSKARESRKKCKTMKEIPTIMKTLQELQRRE